MAATGANQPEPLETFLTEVKAIEKRDAVLTSSQQIERLLRPGSMYFNLNPYECIACLPVHKHLILPRAWEERGLTYAPGVLLIDPDTPDDQVRKAYRKLSILVHPDKNESDKDRAQLAFDAVHKAYKMLQEEEQKGYVLEVVEDAKAMLDMKMEEKRKAAQKQGKDAIDEDDPEKYQQVFRSTLTKVFADLEVKKKKLEERDQAERKRQREQEEAEVEKTKKQKDWKQEWDSKRDVRVDSWRSFQQKGKKKKKISGGLKPPKLKQEKRV